MREYSFDVRCNNKKIVCLLLINGATLNLAPYNDIYKYYITEFKKIENTSNFGKLIKTFREKNKTKNARAISEYIKGENVETNRRKLIKEYEVIIKDNELAVSHMFEFLCLYIMEHMIEDYTTEVIHEKVASDFLTVAYEEEQRLNIASDTDISSEKEIPNTYIPNRIYYAGKCLSQNLDDFHIKKLALVIGKGCDLNKNLKQANELLSEFKEIERTP